MTGDPVVVLAATQRGWAGRLRAHAADHGGAVVRATVLTPQDALDEPSSVVLVDDITSFLTAGFVRALQGQGRAVLGLHDPGDGTGRQVLVDAGVDALLPADADPEDLLAGIRRLAARHPDDRPSRPVEAAPQPGARGAVIGVLGPTGGVGVTEVALELAAAGAAAERPTTLVDADEVDAVLAQRLGLPLHPNLRTALDGLDRGLPVDPALHRLSTRRPLRVVPGMASGEDWTTVRPTALGDLLLRLAADGSTVVADLGHALASADGPTGLRFGHAAAAVARCDRVLLIAAPTPVAVGRCIALAARLGVADGRLVPVLNRVGRDRFVRDEAVAELRGATGTAAVPVVAEDDAVPAAGWQGRRVARGRFRRDVAGLWSLLPASGPVRAAAAATAVAR